MSASTLLVLDTTPPEVTFADDLVNGALPFTLTEPALTAAELLTPDAPIPLSILNGTIEIPAGHNDALIRVHLRDAVANEAIVEHEISTLEQLSAVFTDHAATTGTLQPRLATRAVPRDRARTAAHATDHATTTARQSDTERP